MRTDRWTPPEHRRGGRLDERRASKLPVIAITLSVFIVCLVAAWVGGRGQDTKVAWVRVWPQTGNSAAELVGRLRRVDGVGDAIAVYRGTLASADYWDTGWAAAYYLANRTNTASLAFLPPDPGLTLWKGQRPDVSSPDEALIAYELAQSLGIGVGDTLDVRGLPFQVVGVWGPSARVPGNWLQVSSAAADLIDSSSSDSASYVMVLPTARSEAQQVAERIRDRWIDLEVTSPNWEQASSQREGMLMAAAMLVATVIGLLLGVLAIGASEVPTAVSLWVVAAAGASGVALSWVASTFANWYARTTSGLTPLAVGVPVVGFALVLTLLIYLLGRLPVVRQVGFHFASSTALFCLCAAAVVVMGAARESLSLTLDAARRTATDWVSLGDTTLTESLLQEIYRLPGIRGLAMEAYGGPVREEDTRWRGEIPVAGVLYGVEFAGGVGSWTLPFSGAFLNGGDLDPGTDQAVIAYELARDLGVGVGDVFLARGIPLQVVGVRSQVLPFPGSDAGRRVYVTFDTLGRILRERDVKKQVTLLVPSAESQEQKQLFLREVASRLRVGQLKTIDDRLAEIVVNYPGAWTITGSSSTEAIRHARSLYHSLLALVVLPALAVTLQSLTVTWTRSVAADRERIGVLKALGSTEGRLLGDYVLRIVLLGASCGLVGVVVGQVACGLFNRIGYEGAFRLAVTPGLAAAVFVGSVFAALVGAVAPVAGAIRQGATEALYTTAAQSAEVFRSSAEATHGGS